MAPIGKRLFLAAGMVWTCLADADRPVRVDAEGVLRWSDDGSEVALLGVNTYTPFTIDYAEILRLGLDHQQVIRDDVAHFRRLGLGCVRVHCFDRQFSDVDGNLIDNKHLDLLDFLIDECRRNGLYTVLTPIAWWGGGKWAEGSHGFSDVYDMRKMTTDRTAWAIQARFLKQFAEHVNRYTGRRYADDPCVLAFECINEPLYPKETPDSLVTEYINTLTDALRASGTAKPVYYNSWLGRNAAAGASRADGVTCSSYPTGLVAGHALTGSQLGAVRGSSLQPDPSISRKTRMAYEFDAADVPGSHMYPAMAKLFRSEGVQVASQFQYDALPLASVNQNWQTHHLNLVYTPGKALSFAIAAEVFARVPRGTPYERSADRLLFPPFRVSADEDLSELVTPDRYLASNTTRTPPPDPAALARVWGCGSSPVVAYGGTGAYFLDRVCTGVWRLQLYPDVFTVADPYTGTPEPKVRVIPGRHAMTLRLPDLGEAFSVWPFDGEKAGDRLAAARGGLFEAEPGDYLLTRGGRLPAEALTRQPAHVPRYVAPKPEPLQAPLLRADAPRQWRAGTPLELRAEAVFATNLTARFTSSAGAVRDITLTPGAGYGFTGVLPGDALTPGAWGVTFRATGPHGTHSAPDAKSPGAAWRPAPGASVPLLRLPEQPPALIRNGVAGAEVALTASGAARTLRLTVEGADRDRSVAGYTLPFPKPPQDALTDSGIRWGLRIVAHGGDAGARVELGFRMRNGQGFGYNLLAGKGRSETLVPAAEMVPLWGLPAREAFRWQEVEQVSVLTGAWLWQAGEKAETQTFGLEALDWVPLEPALPLTACDGAEPWNLFDVAAWMRVPLWNAPLQRRQLRDSQGQAVLRLGADRFDGEHDSVGLRAPCDGKTFARLWQTDGDKAVLHLRVRAAAPKTTAFELVLLEAGNVAWGANVPLTPEWRTVRLPARNLRLFTNWDNSMAERAGPHLRLSRLEAVNVCFGKWLFPAAASEPHAFEIAAIGVSAE